MSIDKRNTWRLGRNSQQNPDPKTNHLGLSLFHQVTCSDVEDVRDSGWFFFSIWAFFHGEKISHEHFTPPKKGYPPEVEQLAPEKWLLEDYSFLLGPGNFSGASC